MSKKQIAWVVIVTSLVVAGIIGGLLYMQNKSTKSKNSESVATDSSGRPITLNSNKSATIPLGGSSNSQESSGSSLSVTTGAPSNSAQLGSGNQPQSGSSAASGSGSTSSSAPGPESFGQYNQYQNSANSLFGDIVVGTGKTITSGKRVAVLYEGWLTNGQLFDQALDTSKPFIYTPGTGSVIKGWEESIPGMKVGGKRRIIVPPSVGYGSTAQGSIPANSLLIFDVQLVDAE